MALPTKRVAAGTDWRTKPTDRFVLKWIKLHLSAPITPRLVRVGWLAPWMLTCLSAAVGSAGGVVYALGLPWAAGLLAAVGQVVDGADGQYARITGAVTLKGAFLDSVLDRYADGAMVIGSLVYLLTLRSAVPSWLIWLVGSFALLGSNAVSYSGARAADLHLDAGPPTRASKGTRSTVMILTAWGAAGWNLLPLVGLAYLAVHPNLAVLARILRARER